MPSGATTSKFAPARTFALWPQPAQDNFTAIDDAEGLGGAFGRPLLEIDIALGPEPHQNLPLPNMTFQRFDPLFMAAVQTVGNPQQRDQKHQCTPLIAVQSIQIGMVRRGHGLAVEAAEIGDELPF